MPSTFYGDVASIAGIAALFPQSEDALEAVVSHATSKAASALGAIYAVPPAERTFLNTVRAADLAQGEFAAAMSVLAVVKNTAVSRQLREAANRHINALQSTGIDLFSSNRQLHASLVEYTTASQSTFEKELGPTSQCPSPAAVAERRYWLENELSEYKRRGLELPQPEFDHVVALQKRIAELVTAFNTNIAEDRTSVLLAPEELVGVPEATVAALKPDPEGSGKLVVRMDYPTYFAIVKNCEIAETRKLVMSAFETRAWPQNSAVLKALIRARHNLALALGYRSYTQFDLENKMVRTPEAAQAFINDLVPPLQAKWALEKAALISSGLHPSIVLCGELGDCLHFFDIPFALNEYKKRQLQVSETEIQEYFPLDSTIKGIFSIYQQFFDVTFTKWTAATEAETQMFWHESVQVLSITDNRTKQLLGHIVLDLFPREGKYSHACCHSVVPACKVDDTKDGGIDDEFFPAVSVVIANFPQASGDKPALLMHDDVLTCWHELGHALHAIFGRSRMVTFAGTRVKRDFVETPSQCIEEWLWDEKILGLITRHYKTGATLPHELISAKVHSQNAFSGRDMLRQLHYATFSLHLFDDAFAGAGDAAEPATLLYMLAPAIVPGIEFNPSGHSECSFSHLGGYGPLYVSYAWSEVLALDIFASIKERDGLLCPEMGRRYAREILGVGGGKCPHAAVKAFLGREPSNVAFLAKLGICKPSTK